MKARLSVMAALVALGAGAWAAIGGAATRTASTSLPSGNDTATATATCPAGKRVVLGGIRGEDDPQFSAGTIFPGELARTSKRELRVGGYNNDDQARNLTAIATCKRRPKSKETSSSITLPGGDLGTTTAKCPKGKRIVFGGFRAGMTANEAFVLLTAAKRESNRRWTVEGYNNSDDPGELTALAYCGKTKKAKEVVTETVTAEGSFGEGTAEAQCPPGTKLRYGGFEGESDPASNGALLDLERTSTRSWQASGLAYSGEPRDLTAIAYCR